MRYAFPAAWFLAAAFTLAGCGDGESAAPAAGSLQDIDACALLTAAEIEAATGIAPGPAENQGGRNAPPMCNWPSQDGAYPFAASLLVTVSANYTSYEQALAAWQESAADMGMDFDWAMYEEVDGPGTVNAWMADAGMLQAHRGDRMVQVYLHRLPPDRDRLQAATELATRAFARLD
ncbi:MAG TPA: hypothetical protein VKZ85_00725 [Woeseiaceae bacterium]|nr:hypothetical protein [Woeseiaceae bacterium]